MGRDHGLSEQREAQCERLVRQLRLRLAPLLRRLLGLVLDTLLELVPVGEDEVGMRMQLVLGRRRRAFLVDVVLTRRASGRETSVADLLDDGRECLDLRT